MQIHVDPAGKGQWQILNRDMQTSPERILNAVDWAGCEHLKLHVLSQWILSLATSDVRVSRNLYTVRPLVIVENFLCSHWQGHLLFHLFTFLFFHLWALADAHRADCEEYGLPWELEVEERHSDSRSRIREELKDMVALHGALIFDLQGCLNRLVFHITINTIHWLNIIPNARL